MSVKYKNVTFRARESEVKAWQAAAEKDGRSMSSWIRQQIITNKNPGRLPIKQG